MTNELTGGAGLDGEDVVASDACEREFSSGGDRCCAWVESVSVVGERVGVAGRFGCESAESGAAILREALAWLRESGCTLAIGPMDGNTWRQYRLVTGNGEAGADEPAFFLEPVNAVRDVEAFVGAGFGVLAKYYSARVDDLMCADARLGRVRERLAREGVVIRPLDMGRFEAEARVVFELSLVAFASNFLYTPIGWEEFLLSYQKVKPVALPEACLLAWRGAELVGFVFCLPDVLEKQRTGAVRTLIVKTLAVWPGREFAGLGGLLVEEAQHAAHRLGFRRAIHALMHEENKSRNIAGQGSTIREYALFSKALRG